jgi:DNA-directed RNA polymerase specialized sigma subunit
MNWKREAIDKLKNYEAHREALENIPKEIKRLESAYAGIRSATTDGTPVSGGGNTREDSMLSNIVHRDELKRRLKEARLWVAQVDKALAVLDDEERLVLDRFYIHRAKGNVGELCERLNVEQATVYRKRDSALRRFTIALYGVTETE